MEALRSVVEQAAMKGASARTSPAAGHGGWSRRRISPPNCRPWRSLVSPGARRSQSPHRRLGARLPQPHTQMASRPPAGHGTLGTSARFVGGFMDIGGKARWRLWEGEVRRWWGGEWAVVGKARGRRWSWRRGGEGRAAGTAARVSGMTGG
jgi:hypothetical protein